MRHAAGVDAANAVVEIKDCAVVAEANATDRKKGHMGLLDGKVAVVTGASKGIGAGIAHSLGAAGAAVVVTYASAHRTRPQGTWKLQDSFYSANSAHPLFERDLHPNRRETGVSTLSWDFTVRSDLRA